MVTCLLAVACTLDLGTPPPLPDTAGWDAAVADASAELDAARPEDVEAADDAGADSAGPPDGGEDVPEPDVPDVPEPDVPDVSEQDVPAVPGPYPCAGDDCPPPPVAHWRFDGDLVDHAGGADAGVFKGLTPGFVDTGWGQGIRVGPGVPISVFAGVFSANLSHYTAFIRLSVDVGADEGTIFGLGSSGESLATNAYSLKTQDSGKPLVLATEHGAGANDQVTLAALGAGGAQHRVAVVVSGGQIWSWVDGQAGAPQPLPAFESTSTALTLGSFSTGASQLDGVLDDVRFYDQALTAGQLAKIVEGDAPPTAQPPPGLPTCSDTPGGCAALPAPVAHWRLDGDGADASGNYPGVPSANVTWIDGPSGKAAQFAAYPGRVDISSFADKMQALVTDPEAEVTIALWFRRDALSGGFFLSLGTEGADLASNMWGLELVGDSINQRSEYGEGQKNPTLGLTPALAVGSWGHVAIVIKDGQVSTYRGGLPSKTQAYKTAQTTSQQVLLGQFSQTPAALHHALDDVRVYDKALTAEQIVAVLDDSLNPAGPDELPEEYPCDAAVPADCPPAPVAHWRFDGDLANHAGGGSAQTYPGHVAVFEETPWTQGLQVAPGVKADAFAATFLALKEAFTAVMRFRLDSVAERRVLFALGDNAETQAANSWWLEVNNGTLKVLAETGDGEDTLQALVAMPDDDLHHTLVLTVADGDLKIWLDDKAFTTVAAPALQSQSGTFRIGAFGPGLWPMHGVIDDLRFYDVPLTTAQMEHIVQGWSPPPKPLPAPGPTCTTSEDGCPSVPAPVAHWPLDGNATDSAGGFDGVATNVAWPSGVHGQAAQFSDYQGTVALSAFASKLKQLVQADAMSVSFWLRRDAVGGYGPFMYLGGKGESLSTNLWALRVNGGALRLQTEVTGGADTNHELGPIATAGVWTHFTLVVKDATITAYHNGQVGGAAPYVAPNTTSGTFALGHFPESKFAHAHTLDDVMFFDVALTPAQVQAHWAESVPVD